MKHLELKDLWNPEGAPFDASLLEKLETPWELLDPQKMKATVAGELEKPSLLPESCQGFVSEAFAYANGEVIRGKMEVQGMDKACKGEMQVRVDGKIIEGAAFVMAGAYLSGKIALGEGALIQTAAMVQGPVVLAKHAEVRQGGFIRGNVLVGEAAIVGHTSEIKNSILFKNAKAPHFAYVGDSILGAGVNLGAGTKLSNLKITTGNVTLPTNGDRIDSGLRKFGAVLGDGVQTGCNSVLNPGVVAGRESLVYPCVAVRAGVYKPKSIIRK